ncbi:MAG TPA: ComEC/Rec2 family competence protein [Pyrinomonadaceae bacterium]|nr:ComEC/Rec2 family competence protein [Pyrinomonadaceae bacterium]
MNAGRGEPYNHGRYITFAVQLIVRAVLPHRPFFNACPLGLLAASFAAGILLARASAPPLVACLACFALTSAAALLASFARRGEPYAASLVLAAFVCAGATLATAEKGSAGGSRVRGLYESGRIESGEPVELTGVLERAPEWSPEGFGVTLRVERLRFRREERGATGRVELFAPLVDDEGAPGTSSRERYDALELRRGARVRVLVSLSRAERYRNPGVGSFAEYLERRDLDAAGTLKSPLLVERLDDERVLLPLVWLDDARAWTIARVNALFTRPTAGVLNASLLGNRGGLTRATGERFREGGTFHLLVISGMHITFVGAAAWWLARLVTRRRAWQFASAALLVWAYAFAVGAESSVVRAALMFTLVALAPVLHRPASAPNALGGAALALLAWSPRTLFDPSFQLTFLSVLLIVAVAWPLLERLKAVGEWRPTRATPHPPVCPAWWRALGEALFWNEKEWRRELARSTYSCALFKSPLAARLERARVQPVLRYAFGAALVSACVQAGLLPFMVVYFHRFSFASLFLNVFAGACMAALSLASLAAVAVSALDERAAAPLVWLAERLAWASEHGVEPFAAAGVASLRLPAYEGAASIVYALYYAPLVFLAVTLARWRPVPPAAETERRETENSQTESDTAGAAENGPATKYCGAVRRLIQLIAGAAAFASRRCAAVRASCRRVGGHVTVRLAASALAGLFVVILAHPFAAPRPEGRLRVDFLDVGQGDAALVTMPDGATLLVDGGGRPRWRDEGEDETAFEPDRRGVGESVVSEFLWWRGLDAVDYALATHADADHVEGLADIFANFPVRAALVARAPAGDAEYARFARSAAARGVPVYALARGDTLRFGGVSVDVLWPPRETPQARAPSRNDDSIVLRLRYGRRSILLTGDIEATAEARLLAAREDLRADAAKVAHHGSRTSSSAEFVAAVGPRVAVVPVGRDSPYGHPHAEVVRRWRDAGARLLTTGRCGTVTVSTDGDDLKVETFVRNGECHEE